MKATTLDVYTMSPLAVASCLCYSECMCIAEWSSNVGKSSARIIPHLSELNHSGHHCPCFRDFSLSQTLTPNPPVLFLPRSVIPEFDFWCLKREFPLCASMCSKTQNHLIKSKLRYISASCLIPSLRERGPLIWKLQHRQSLNNLVVPLNYVTEECKMICGEKLLYIVLCIANRAFKTFPQGDVELTERQGYKQIPGLVYITTSSVFVDNNSKRQRGIEKQLHWTGGKVMGWKPA